MAYNDVPFPEVKIAALKDGALSAGGGLTNTELRATPVPVSGTVTASGPLTDAQLRATPVPVSGTVTASGPLTDTQLRATAVPVVPTGATPTAATPTQIIKTVAALATPEALAADNSFFVTALIGGLKAARTANVGVVYLGIGATNDTQPFAINSGEWLTINAPVGQKYDLNDWYLDVLNAGDGVAVIYS